MNQLLYEAREIKEILGIGKDQLFHWVVTKSLVKPIIKGEGRGRRSKFSKANLLQLGLIQELVNLAVDLNAIRKIMKGLKKTDFKREIGHPVLDTSVPFLVVRKKKNKWEHEFIFGIEDFLKKSLFVYSPMGQRKGGFIVIELLSVFARISDTLKTLDAKKTKK